MTNQTLVPADKVLASFDRYIKYSGSDPNSKEFTMLRRMISQDGFVGDDNFTVVEYFTIQQLVARVWRRMLTLFNTAVEGHITPQKCQEETSFLFDKLTEELQKSGEPTDPNTPRKLYLAKRPARPPRHR